MPSSISDSLIYATVLYVGAITHCKVEHIRVNPNNKPLTATGLGQDAR